MPTNVEMNLKKKITFWSKTQQVRLFQNVYIKAHCFGDETAHCQCTSTRGRYGKGLGSAGLLKEAVHLRCLSVKLGDSERGQIIQVIYTGQNLKTK